MAQGQPQRVSQKKVKAVRSRQRAEYPLDISRLVVCSVDNGLYIVEKHQADGYIVKSSVGRKQMFALHSELIPVTIPRQRLRQLMED